MDQELARLRDELLAAYSEHVPTDRPWVFVDFPAHFNLGDSAIACGELAAADAVGADVVHGAQGRWFSPHRVPAGAVVLLQGGGNLGGLYDADHRLQLRALELLRGHQIVQLPQSVQFTGARSRGELQRAVAAHGNVTVMVRDQRSYERAMAAFDCKVVLTPDAAFALGPLERVPPVQDLLVMHRRDREAPPNPDAQYLATAIDWPPPTDRAEHWRLRFVRRLQPLSPVPVIGTLLDRALWPVWMRFLHDNLARSLHTVGGGRLFITDRLHGHVIASLCGVPHIVVNDRYGKIESLWRTWTHDIACARFAATWADAVDMVDQVRIELT